MRIHFFILMIFASFWMQAQEQEHYSFINERIFDDPTDLIGYNFRPFKMEIPGEYEPKKIDAGEYSFGITRGRLYVNGDKKIRGLYEVNNIEPSNYGFKLTLLDPSNPANRGHLKVIINKYLEAEAVVFKPERKAGEIIFHLPDASKKMLKREQNYFTDLGEIAVEDADSLWGMKFFPYMRKNLGNNIQDRLYEMDSTSISFEEVITIKEKKKKKKKSKKRRKKKKTKEVEEEKEPSIAEIEAEEMEEAAAAAPPQVEEDVVVKRKIIKEYFVKVNTIVKYEDGTKEKKTWTYPVKEITEREDSSARKNEERYQVAIKTKGKKEIYLYLNGDRTVSSFEAGGVLYWMRGH